MRHLAIETGIYSIEDLAKHYQAKTRGHWFDKDTLRFFRSRLNENLFYCGTVILFITSEHGPHQPKRRYSIRQYNPSTGSIETVGLGFQGYASLAAAKRAAQLKTIRVEAGFENISSPA